MRFIPPIFPRPCISFLSSLFHPFPSIIYSLLPSIVLPTVIFRFPSKFLCLLSYSKFNISFYHFPLYFLSFPHPSLNCILFSFSVLLFVFVLFPFFSYSYSFVFLLHFSSFFYFFDSFLLCLFLITHSLPFLFLDIDLHSSSLSLFTSSFLVCFPNSSICIHYLYSTSKREKRGR